MALYVTLDEAKRHLKESWADTDPDEADLQLKLDAAEAAMLTYLDQPMATLYDPAMLPADIKHAILLQVGVLWRVRGDDNPSEERPRGVSDEMDFHPAIRDLLRRYRNHAI